MAPESLKPHVYIFSAFFYDALAQNLASRGEVHYTDLTSFNPPGGIFSYLYSVIPVQTKEQWYFIIIDHTETTIEEQKGPIIHFFVSPDLHPHHQNDDETESLIVDYLNAAKRESGDTYAETPPYAEYHNIPVQSQPADQAIYPLVYLMEFFARPQQLLHYEKPKLIINLQELRMLLKDFCMKLIVRGENLASKRRPEGETSPTKKKPRRSSTTSQK